MHTHPYIHIYMYIFTCTFIVAVPFMHSHNIRIALLTLYVTKRIAACVRIRFWLFVAPFIRLRSFCPTFHSNSLNFLSVRVLN